MKLYFFLKKIFFYFIIFLVNLSSKKNIFPKNILNFLDNIKRTIFNLLGSKIGLNSYLRTNAYILEPKNLIIGENVTIGFNCRIINHSKVEIGDNTEIGENLYLINIEHVWKNPNLPLGKQGMQTKEIKIGKGVYIGSNVTILGGVTISDNVVIGACSLINKNLKSGFLYCGVPAKPIKPLFDANKN